MAFVRKHGQKMYALLPACISWAAAAKDTPIYLIVVLLSILLIAESNPLFCGREVIGVFLMAAFALVPWNIKFAARLNDFFIYAVDGIVLYAFRILLVFMIFSLEEIVLCRISRMIWRDQEEVKL